MLCGFSSCSDSLKTAAIVRNIRTAERVSLSAFVDPDDYERLVERARAQDRSTSAELRVAIREHLRERVTQRDDCMVDRCRCPALLPQPDHGHERDADRRDIWAACARLGGLPAQAP